MGIIIRQGFKAALSNYIGTGLGFLSLFILFPLFYNPTELGAVRIFLELASVLSAFALMGTHYSINRFFPFFRTQDQKHHGFFFWVLVFPLLGYSLLTIILVFSGNSVFYFINPDALKYKALFPMLLLLILIILYQTVSETTCANYGRIAVPNFMKEIVMRVLIIVAGLLFYFKIISFYTSIWCIVSSYLIALAGNLFFLSRITKINLRPDFNFIKNNNNLRNQVLQFTVVLFFSGTVALIAPKIDFFLISSIRKSLADVAIYSIGFYLATFIEIPKRTILQVAVPIISNHMKNENFKEVEILNKKNGTNQFLISGILFFLIWLNIDNLYMIMPRGDYYAKGKWVVFFIGISKLIDAIMCGNGPIIINSKFYPFSFFSIIIFACSAIGFNLLLIPKYGILGGAISTIIVMTCVNLCNLLVLYSKLKIHPFEFQQVKIFIVVLVFISITFLGNWFSNPYVDGAVRTIVLGLLLLVSIYKLRLSEDFNQLLRSKLSFLPN
jgi:O-antigen/teichoic acid export membrane protein